MDIKELYKLRDACSEKERLFAHEYVNVGSVQLASFMAQVDRRTGTTYLNDEDVCLYIQALKDYQSDRLNITMDRILHEMALIAFSNPMDYLTPNDDDPTKFDLDLSALTREQAASISEFKTKTTKFGLIIEQSIKFHSKTDMLKAIGVQVGMISERSQNNHTAGDQDAAKSAIDDLITKTAPTEESEEEDD